MSEAAAPAQHAAAGAPAASGGGLMKILGLAGVVFAIGNLGATGFLTTKVMAIPHCEEKAPAHVVPEGAIGPTFALDTFVVNLNETESTRYLKTTFEVELADAHAVDRITRLKPAVRDEVLRYLSSLTVQDTLGEEAKARIRVDLAERLTKTIDGGVRKLYFSEFVVQ